MTRATARFSEGDDVNVFDATTRALAAAQAPAAIPSQVEAFHPQHGGGHAALEREVQLANTIDDRSAHRRALVEREAAERDAVSVDTMSCYLRFAFDPFGQAGLNEAMTRMTAIGQQVRATDAIVSFRAWRDIPEAAWAA